MDQERKDGILARFDEASQVLFGGRLHTDRAELETAIDSGADKPRRASGPTQALEQTLLALKEAQNELAALKGQKDEAPTLVLTPGTAVLCPDGALAPSGQGTNWCTPGDFRLYLEPSDGEQADPKLVRELLIGSWREFDERGDFELPEGTFLDEAGWKREVESLGNRVFELMGQIGELPEGAHPDEIKPRASTWLGERANWETEVTHLQKEAANLREAVSSLTKRNEELLTASVAGGLPQDAREKLIAIKGVGEKLADEILATLSPTQEPPSPTQEFPSA